MSSIGFRASYMQCYFLARSSDFYFYFGQSQASMFPPVSSLHAKLS